MIGCPTGAIGRNENGLVMIDEGSCIGCSICATACPYDNIQMVEPVDPDGRSFRDSDGEPVQVAAKCDRCVDIGGSAACVDACPHEAIVRIDLSETENLLDWLSCRSK